MTRSQVNERWPCTRVSLAAALLRVVPGFKALDEKRLAEQMALKLEAK